MTDVYFEKPRPEPEQDIMRQLVTIRRQSGLRNRDIARRMNVTGGAISALETSAKRGHSVTLERLLRYADAIGAQIRIEPKDTP
jgi:transcriptional regulator with XRE-family HTH domain